MPTEIRKIIFSTKETLSALRQFCKSSGQDFPNDDGLDLALINTDEKNLKAQLKSNSGENLRGFNSSELAASLMQLCMTTNIPISRRSRKTVDMHQGNLALVLKTSPV